MCGSVWGEGSRCDPDLICATQSKFNEIWFDRITRFKSEESADKSFESNNFNLDLYLHFRIWPKAYLIWFATRKFISETFFTQSLPFFGWPCPKNGVGWPLLALFTLFHFFISQKFSTNLEFQSYQLEKWKRGKILSLLRETYIQLWYIFSQIHFCFFSFSLEFYQLEKWKRGKILCLLWETGNKSESVLVPNQYISSITFSPPPPLSAIYIVVIHFVFSAGNVCLLSRYWILEMRQSQKCQGDPVDKACIHSSIQRKKIVGKRSTNLQVFFLCCDVGHQLFFLVSRRERWPVRVFLHNMQIWKWNIHLIIDRKNRVISILQSWCYTVSDYDGADICKTKMKNGSSFSNNCYSKAHTFYTTWSIWVYLP